MKQKLIILLLILAGFKNIFASGGKKDTICIIQINDIYEISPLEAGKVAGLARIAHIIKESRSHYTTYSTLAGDFLSPSVFSSAIYEGEKIYGKQMVDGLNKIGIDYVTFGNHEFDIPAKSLQKRIDESNFTWISANVFQNDSLHSPFYKNTSTGKISFPATIQLKSASGKLKVGVFAVTLPENIQPFVYYKDIQQVLNSVIPDLEKENDLIIGLTHLTYTEDSLMLNQHRTIRLIMGGHEHQHMYIPSGSGAVAKADANGKTIYKHLIYRDRKNKIVVKSELVKVDESIPMDQETNEKVKYWENLIAKSFRAIGLEPYEYVCTIKEKLNGLEFSIRYEQNNMGDLITSAMFHNNTTIDAAIMNSGGIRIDDYVSGAITQMDIIRILPYGGQVLNVTLKGSLLKKILEENDSRKGLGGFLQLGKNISKTQNTWTIKGLALNEEQNYTIALVDYLVSGKEQKMGYFNPTNPEIIKIEKVRDANEKAVDIRKMLIDYLKTRDKE